MWEAKVVAVVSDVAAAAETKWKHKVTHDQGKFIMSFHVIGCIVISAGMTATGRDSNPFHKDTKG